MRTGFYQIIILDASIQTKGNALNISLSKSSKSPRRRRLFFLPNGHYIKRLSTSKQMTKMSVAFLSSVIAILTLIIAIRCQQEINFHADYHRKYNYRLHSPNYYITFFSLLCNTPAYVHSPLEQQFDDVSLNYFNPHQQWRKIIAINFIIFCLIVKFFQINHYSSSSTFFPQTDKTSCSG